MQVWLIQLSNNWSGKMTFEILEGSLTISKSSEEFLNDLVYNKNEPLKDAPFESMVETFRFAFALGLSKNESRERVGATTNIVRSAFTSMDYIDLLKEEAAAEDCSLGQLISGYVEGGVHLMREQIKQGTILELIS
jgi:hypothetical protein